MHLQSLKIKSFRNLVDITITFDEKFTSHAIIGQNGSGKSNFLEAIITIFRDLDLQNPASLEYEMNYLIRGHEIRIKANPGKLPEIQIDGEEISATKFSEHSKEYLPSHIFTYYSGKNERIEKLFQAHIQKFIRLERSYDREVLDENLLNPNLSPEVRERLIIESKEKSNKLKIKKEEFGRRLFFCRPGHTQLVLLACLLSEDERFKKLLEDLNILELDSALFVLKEPNSLKTNITEKDILEGDSRFWYARGTVVTDFLDKLWQVAIAPINDTIRKQIDFRGRNEKQEQIYLYVKDKEDLMKLGELVGTPERFFEYAEGAYIGDLIEEVRISVKHKTSDGTITFDYLSEGELQLLTVLGLMRLTSQDHCLFLLDEPDTHLNPIWKLRYFEEIEKVLQRSEEQTIKGDSQILITTHDPIMIGSLKKEQVKILRKKEGETSIYEPDQDPQGMGVSGLLKSELFGLSSTVDSETRIRMTRRNYLYALGGKRTKEEDAEMTKLSDELADLGFAQDFRDPMYAKFVQQMALKTKFDKEILTPEEIKEQDRIASEIISKILEEEEKSL